MKPLESLLLRSTGLFRMPASLSGSMETGGDRMRHWRLHPDLPIFAVQKGMTHVLYVPGYVMPASEGLLEELRKAWLQPVLSSTKISTPAVALEILDFAAKARNTWLELHTEPFMPQCLNVQFHYACNLACSYCYTRRQSTQIVNPLLNHKAFSAAMELVAKNCVSKGVPFQLVVQGLGEPTLLWNDLKWCVKSSRETAASLDVPWSGHLSTNGQIDVEQAAWIGKNFTHVTVSCDGPPDIQDFIRPRKDGKLSSTSLLDCCDTIADSGAELEARVTITNANAQRLDEVVRYIFENLGICKIRMETVFASGAESKQLPSPLALAQLCLEACDSAILLGAELHLSSPSLTQIHGEYCEASRQSLRLMPDGTAVNCMHGVCCDRSRAISLGHYDNTAGVFLLDETSMTRLRPSLIRIPSACSDCINIYHCTRSCPDICTDISGKNYHCLFQRHLAETWILRAVSKLADESPPKAIDIYAERKHPNGADN